MAVEKIFEHARGTPGKIALVYGTRSISYGCLASWIWHAHRFLSSQGLRRGSLAVLDVECLVDAWVFGFALRGLGLTTVSIRSLDWLDRLGLRNIGCIVSATREEPPRSLPSGEEIKLIRIPWGLYLGQPEEAFPGTLGVDASPGGHILLTSGTTGISKKVLVGEAQLASILRRRASVYGVTEYSMVNLFAFSMSSGTAYKMPICVWSAGGTVVLYQALDQHKALAAEGITHARFTPGSLAEILQAPPGELRRSQTMQAFVGGGPLTRALASEAKARLTPHVFATVSSTEVGTWAMTRIESDEDLRLHRIHPSVEVQIVDEQDQPLPAGQKGLVRIRAPDGVTGYLDDEDASRTAFRHGYFYSGDLGTLQGDGRLMLQGRANNVINVLGQKVAVEVMELAIQEKLQADGVCVLSRQTQALEAEIHIVIQSRRTIGQEELALSIGPWLPGIPKFEVHFLDFLPRTGTGKIDRAALRQIYFGGSSGA
jgi:non-ribosomal peptide synthetase component E (peptide arylation enzyme)